MDSEFDPLKNLDINSLHLSWQVNLQRLPLLNHFI